MAYVNLHTLTNQAFEHLQNKELDQAEKKLSYLVDINPDNPILYYYIGNLFLERKQYAFALMAYQKGTLLEPEFDECYSNAGLAYRQLGHLKKSIEYFEKALKIANHPNYIAKCTSKEAAVEAKVNYITNLGTCYIANGTPQKASEIMKEALRMSPDNRDCRWNNGLAYLEMGNYIDGFVNYDYGNRVGDEQERSYHGGPKSTPWWDGVNGQTIVIYGEQGIGDEIMFASILPDIIKNNTIILDCHSRLMDLFRNSFPEITVYGTRKALCVDWAKNHKIDSKLAIGSLAKFFRKDKKDFPGTPYLKADPILIKKMKSRLEALSSRPKIGLSWKGGIGITNKAHRTIPLNTFKPLFDFDVDFVSLQYHCNAQHEADVFNEANGKTIINHWQDVVEDYDLTAALISNLDLIISVPQSVVHLAGSLGIKTYQICPVKALWQMGVYGEDAPWYKCVKNYWQLIDGRWEDPINNIFLQLESEGYKRCL